MKKTISKSRRLMLIFQLKPIWRANDITRYTKLSLLSSNLKYLLYGCKTYQSTEAIKKKSQVFVNYCLRKVLNI